MRYLFFALLVAAAVWYFFFNGSSAPDLVGARVVPQTPQKQFETLLSSGTVDASRLASQCSSYPQLGAQLLRGKQIKIKGTVAEVRTAGMDGRRAEVVLVGEAARKIVLVCNLDQYSGPGVNFRYLGKFEAVGTELLYLVQHDRILTKKVVVTQGADVTQFCALNSISASLIEFQMVNGPMWANAETNH